MITRPVLLTPMLALLVLQPSCHEGISITQTWRLLITYQEDKQPADDVRVFNVFDERTRSEIVQGVWNEDFAVFTFHTDTNGFAEIHDGRLVVCNDGSLGIGTKCDDVEMTDFNTGTTESYFVNDGTASELLDIQLEVGNSVSGNVFAIEVIAISPPE